MSLNVLDDYMLDTKVDKMRQIEFNTISSAFAGLTGIVADLHKAILRYGIEYSNVRELKPDENQEKSSTIDLILPNNALKKSAEAMLKAFELYNNPNACILFLIVPNERNVCDQNALIDAIQKLQPTIRFHLKTFQQLANELLFDEKTFNIYLKPSHDEIAIVYYRAGYIPDHYTNDKCWLVREHIEQSRAIKCPTVRSQLAGCKIVQEYLTHDNIIEKYITDENVSKTIRSTFASMFTFDNKQIRKKNIEILRQNVNGYVLKPNREGGGNNKYGDDILTVIEKEDNHLDNYIAMEKILPPICTACLIKPNGKHLLNVECINEIGIYGTMVANVDTNEEYINEVTGYLVRTKTTDTNEGGVATGYSVLDCLDVSVNDNRLAEIFAQKLGTF
jgi:glutathione synthase